LPEAGPSAGHRRLFGRRRGKKLRAGRLALVEHLLPQLSLAPAGLAAPLEPRQLFPSRPARIWLEVGCGAGEHLAAQAESHPEIGFIAVEPYLAGLARLLAHVHERRLSNVRVFADDAALLLDALPEASLDRLFLLFPDPWPKARHAGRRFVSAANIARAGRTLRDGAEWRIATDDAGYCRWTLRYLAGDGAFHWLAESAADWRLPPADWAPTRSEQKARAAGRACFYLRFQRRARPT
jgi:tRNA (guanine-N7-)-methyltransferase